MRHDVKLVVSPFPNSPLLSRLFGVKGDKASGVLEIDPEARTVRISGAAIDTPDGTLSFTFDDIKEVESKALYYLTFRLHDGREIHLRGIDALYGVLRALTTHGVADRTQPRVRDQITRHEKRRLHVS
ncbi:MAG: hypothetical protein M5R40_14950 [Anaerolineae bacterium]|nr:hypothetical protein [Anaerolineae bacterium]